MMITSKSNPRIKFIKELRKKKTRDETGLFYVEGIRPVGAAFETGWEIEEILLAPGLLRSDFALGMIDKAGKSGLTVTEISNDVFLSVSDKEGPQGISAIVHQKYSSLDTVQQIGGIWVGLESIQDPGNLGSIMRTADSSGAKGLILLGNFTDPFGMESVRASMGAVFSIGIVPDTFENFRFWQENSHFEIIGTTDKAISNYRKIDYPTNLILMMGSEQKGLSESLINLCTNMVSIPMVGKSDSLNLAVATGIILYEILNQHSNRTEKG
jgi:TrmH family RNA methyltransferase